MLKAIRSKTASLLLIFSSFLFYTPHLLNAEAVGKGNLIGFVYDKDEITPLEGAIFKLKNISSGVIYKSNKTDKLGAFKIEGIDEGLYVASISLKEGDFNVKGLTGIKAGETAKIFIALKPIVQKGAAVKKDKKCPRGDWYIPEEEGECYEGYIWNLEKKRCECKKRRRLAAFFSSPVVLAIITASSVAIFYSIVSLAEEEPEASPFKN